MIVLCVNELGGPTGYHKAVVELANGLHQGGHAVTVLGIHGHGDGSTRMLPRWPLDPGITVLTLKTLPAEGGRLLHRNFHTTWSMKAMNWHYTENNVAAVRQLNRALTPEDTIVFTSAHAAYVIHHLLQGEARRARTVLQIHGDYSHHTRLWDWLIEARDSIDSLQTVATGLRDQFLGVFHASDVRFAPNFSGHLSPVPRVAHEGVNIVLPASFQPRKNQLDAIRALARVPDTAAHLTLWGEVRGAYANECRSLADELGLSDRVHMPGFGTATDVYSKADIVLMTSTSEGFGFPLIEAACHGIPTVTYDFDFGPRDAIVDGESGFIVPVGDVDGLAQALARLVADSSLRRELGHGASQVFAERFTDEAVLPQYEAIFGAPRPATVDLRALFATDGVEPIDRGAISQTTIGVGRLRRATVKVTSPIRFHDVEIDTGSGVRPARTYAVRGASYVVYEGVGSAVISYTTSPGAEDRHYLATSTPDGLKVLPGLRRDASYDFATCTDEAVDAVFATATPVMSRVRAKLVVRAAGVLARKVVGDVTWKVRQLAGERMARRTPFATAVGDAPLVDSDPAVDDVVPAVPVDPSTHAGASLNGHDVAGPGPRSVLTAEPTLRAQGGLAKVLRLARAYGQVVRALPLPLVATPKAPARREIARHPHYPVSSGVDNFGVPVNVPSGVAVENLGPPARPTVSLRGEYDWVIVKDAVSTRRVQSPLAYGELFDAVCQAEREHGFFERTTGDGIHVWELGRPAIIHELARALGLWGPTSSVAAAQDAGTYDGAKRLTTAPPARRVVYDFPRRGQSDYRIAAFRDDDSMVVVHPSAGDYPDVTDSNRAWPTQEYTAWETSARRLIAAARVPDVDARPFEEALTRTLGIRVELASHLRRFLLQFVNERDFWTPVFERVQPEEVLLALSAYHPGIGEAARRSGALVSDIQYAATGRYQEVFWYGGKPRYGAKRLYAWSDYWARRTNVYEEHVVVPREHQDLYAAIDAVRSGAIEPRWDLCLIAQPQVFRRLLAFVGRVVADRPDLDVVIAPHPAARLSVHADVVAAGLADRVSVAEGDTLRTIQRSRMCVGGFSTSLWEAAAIGRPTYVLEVPGHELTLDDVATGLFRVARSPQDLVPFEVPSGRTSIFQTPSETSIASREVVKKAGIA